MGGEHAQEFNPLISPSLEIYTIWVRSPSRSILTVRDEWPDNRTYSRSTRLDLRSETPSEPAGFPLAYP